MTSTEKTSAVPVPPAMIPVVSLSIPDGIYWYYAAGRNGPPMLVSTFDRGIRRGLKTLTGDELLEVVEGSLLDGPVSPPQMSFRATYVAALNAMPDGSNKRSLFKFLQVVDSVASKRP